MAFGSKNYELPYHLQSKTVKWHSQKGYTLFKQFLSVIVTFSVI